MMNNQHVPIKAAARFLWRDPDGTRREGSGTTRDISRTGVFIMAHPVPPSGMDVQVVVIVPPAQGNGCQGRLFGKGVTVRVEHEDGQPAGFAAEVLFQPGWASLLLPPDPPAQRKADGPGSRRQSRPLFASDFELQDFAVGSPTFRDLEAADHFRPIGA